MSAETRLVFSNFDLNAGAGLTINGQEIVAPGGIVASDEALVSAINGARFNGGFRSAGARRGVNS